MHVACRESGIGNRAAAINERMEPDNARRMQRGRRQNGHDGKHLG